MNASHKTMILETWSWQDGVGYGRGVDIIFTNVQSGNRSQLSVISSMQQIITRKGLKCFCLGRYSAVFK